MKFSIFTDMLGTDSFEEAVAYASELGFKLIDLRGKLNGNTIDDISLEKATELKSIISKYGLQVNTVNSWAVNPCTFSGPSTYDNYDENHHIKMTEILDHLFDLADIFEAPNVRVYTLHRDEKFNLLTESQQDEQYRHNAAVMRKHAEHAKTRNKILLVENEPPTLTNCARELGLLIKYADHPNLKINWDIVNEWRAGSFPTIEAYEHIKGHLGQTHLKGASRLSNSISVHHPKGLFGNFAIAGNDDFEHEPILKAIAKYDPNAVMTIDTHYHTFYQPDKVGEVEVVRRTKQFFESIV
jgi:3-dehydroshikimate dehydratase